MSIKRITAIVPIAILEALERQLRAQGVPGKTVEMVRGYGEHPDYFHRDLMQENARVVLYASEVRVEEIVQSVVHCAQRVRAPTGILAVETIDRLVSLNDGKDIAPESL